MYGNNEVEGLGGKLGEEEGEALCGMESIDEPCSQLLALCLQREVSDFV